MALANAVEAMTILSKARFLILFARPVDRLSPKGEQLRKA